MVALKKLPSPSITALKPTHGDIRKVNALKRANTPPSHQEIMDIPAAIAGVYELTDKEIKQTRSRIYGLNRDNAFGWRWRTLREQGKGRHDLLLIWRIH